MTGIFKKHITSLILVVFSVVLIVSSSVLHLYLTKDAVSRARDTAYSVMTDSASEQADFLKSAFRSRFAMLSVAAGFIADNGIVNKEKFRRVLAPIARKSGFLSISAVDVHGIAYTSDGASVDVRMKPYYIDLKRSKSKVIKAATGITDSQPRLLFTVPMSANGSETVCVVGECDTASIENSMMPHAFGSESYSFICDSNMNVMLGSVHSFFIEQSNNFGSFLCESKLTEGSTIEKTVNDFREGNPGWVAYTAKNGEKRFTSYSPIGVGDWMICNAIPQQIIADNANYIKSFSLYTGMLNAAVALIFIFLIFFIGNALNKKILKEREWGNELDKRFRIAVRNTTISMWDYCPEEHCIIQTDLSKRQHGFADKIKNVPESLIAAGYVHPDHAARFREMYNKISKGVKFVEGTFLVRSAGKKDWWYEYVQYTLFSSRPGERTRAVGISRDVTERERLKQVYNLEIQSFKNLAEDLFSMTIFDLTSGTQVKSEMSDLSEAPMFKTDSPEQYFTKESKNVVSDETVKNVLTAITSDSLFEAWNSGQVIRELEYIRRFTKGLPQWVHMTQHILKDPTTGHVMLFSYLRVIDRQKRKEMKLQTAAETDSLTSLLNHEVSLITIGAFLSGCGAATLNALFIFDLDHFKLVNDTFGHQAGDDILKTTANTLKRAFRSEDIVGRIGGDEFIAFMKNLSSPEDAEDKAKKLTHDMRFTYTGASEKLDITVSMGIALSSHDDDAMSIYRRADAALYRAKQNGRDGYFIDAAGTAKTKKTS